jgi:hypothetical protein
MLHFSCRDPKKSANQEVYGTFDFNKTPLAPIGTKALIYDDPASRASWAPHATDGIYVGPAPDHYRCLRFYIPATQRFRVSDTWLLYPMHSQIPMTFQHNLSIVAAADLLQALGTTVLYQHQPLKNTSISGPYKISQKSWPDSKPPNHQLTRQTQGWKQQVRGWDMLHLQGWPLHRTTSLHPISSDKCR